MIFSEVPGTSFQCLGYSARECDSGAAGDPGFRDQGRLCKTSADQGARPFWKWNPGRLHTIAGARAAAPRLSDFSELEAAMQKSRAQCARPPGKTSTIRVGPRF